MKLPSGKPVARSAVILPQRQIVRRAANNSVTSCLHLAENIVLEWARLRVFCTWIKVNRNETPDKVFGDATPLPVRITNAKAFKGTITDLPSIRTRAGRSVIALARRSDLKTELLRLSRKRVGLPSINSAEILFSSSSAVAPAVTA